MARLAVCVLGMSVVVLLLWITAFVIACMLVAWANTPPVIDACGGFWEFMLASVLSPVIIPGIRSSVACWRVVSLTLNQ